MVPLCDAGTDPSDRSHPQIERPRLAYPPPAMVVEVAGADVKVVLDPPVVVVAGSVVVVVEVDVEVVGATVVVDLTGVVVVVVVTFLTFGAVSTTLVPGGRASFTGVTGLAMT